MNSRSRENHFYCSRKAIPRLTFCRKRCKFNFIICFERWPSYPFSLFHLQFNLKVNIQFGQGKLYNFLFVVQRQKMCCDMRQFRSTSFCNLLQVAYKIAQVTGPHHNLSCNEKCIASCRKSRLHVAFFLQCLQRCGIFSTRLSLLLALLHCRL